MLDCGLWANKNVVFVQEVEQRAEEACRQEPVEQCKTVDEEICREVTAYEVTALVN